MENRTVRIPDTIVKFPDSLLPPLRAALTTENSVDSALAEGPFSASHMQEINPLSKIFTPDRLATVSYYYSDSIFLAW